MADEKELSLTSLRERVEAAGGADRELDAEIMFDLFAKPVGKREEDGGPMGYLWPEDNPSWSFGIRFPGKDRDWFHEVRKRSGVGEETLVIRRDNALVLMNSLRIPQLTSSLDAAVSLVEKVLPEWTIANIGQDDNKNWWAELREGFLTSFTRVEISKPSKTGALALMAALLHALEERGWNEPT